MQVGASGKRHAVQPQTGINGKTMSKLYVSPGMERVKMLEEKINQIRGKAEIKKMNACDS